jgi:hypothetical protein
MDGDEMSSRALVLIALAALSGCAAPKTLYSWGSYEELIYSSYAQPGSVPPEKQIELLERDYQQARTVNKRVPPGWHAHLGYLYYQAGKLDESVRELQTEKTEYPESAVFVDTLLANLKK